MPKRAPELTVDWHPRRWRGDTIGLSPGACGCWIHTLNDMMIRGVDCFSMTDAYEGFGRRWGCSAGDAGRYIEELRIHNVCVVTTDETGRVTLMSRRRQREAKAIAAQRLRQERYRERRQSNAAGDGDGSGGDNRSTIVFEFDSELMRGPGEGPWYVTQQMHEGWVDAYPELVHLTVYRHIREWLEANPSRRKTRSGMRRFINGWFKREQNRGGSRAAPPKPKTRDDGVA